MVKTIPITIRVCLITPFPPREDGVAEYSKCLVESLQKSSVLISVITQKENVRTVTDEVILDKRTKILRLWIPKSIINQFKVYKTIRETHPDIVHLQYGPYSEYGGFLGEPLLLLFLLLRFSRIKSVVTLHSIWFPAEAESRAYERTGSHFLSKLVAIYYSSFIRIFLRFFDLILVCVNFPGSQISQKIVRQFGLLPSNVKQVVHGSLDEMGFRKPNREIDAPKGKTLLCFGFIRRGKGYDNAIEAIKILRNKCVDVRLIIAGKPQTSDDADYLLSLRKRVHELQLEDAVSFDTRFIPEDALFDYLARSDVLLLPYSRRVGPSGPFALAVSFALPTIMTIDGKFTPKTPESFVRFVPPEDSPALAKAIEEIIRDEKTTELIKAAALSFSSKYSFRESANQHRTIYLDLLRKFNR